MPHFKAQGTVREKHLLQSLLELTEHAPYAYSGRSMYGQRCLAANCTKPLELVAHLLSVLAENIPLSPDAASSQLEELASVLTKTRTDAMGLGTVLYWPNIPFINDGEACPGCGCMPGDGLTEGCEDPGGCGENRKHQ